MSSGLLPPARDPHEPQIIDAPAALDRIGGDSNLLRELAVIFIEDSPVLMHALRTSVADGKLSAAEHCAHGLKGIAANVGGVRVESLAHVVEDALRAGQLELAGACVQNLAGELDQLISALQANLLDHPDTQG